MTKTSIGAGRENILNRVYFTHKNMGKSNNLYEQRNSGRGLLGSTGAVVSYSHIKIYMPGQGLGHRREALSIPLQAEDLCITT